MHTAASWQPGESQQSDAFRRIVASDTDAQSLEELQWVQICWILGPMTARMAHQDEPCITVYKASVMACRSLVTDGEVSQAENVQIVYN